MPLEKDLHKNEVFIIGDTEIKWTDIGDYDGKDIVTLEIEADNSVKCETLHQKLRREKHGMAR